MVLSSCEIVFPDETTFYVAIFKMMSKTQTHKIKLQIR